MRVKEDSLDLGKDSGETHFASNVPIARFLHDSLSFSPLSSSALRRTQIVQTRYQFCLTFSTVHLHVTNLYLYLYLVRYYFHWHWEVDECCRVVVMVVAVHWSLSFVLWFESEFVFDKPS